MFLAIPTRFVVIFLCALNNLISYTIRMNLSVTIVSMVNFTIDDNNLNDTCPIDVEDKIMSNKRDINV